MPSDLNYQLFSGGRFWNILLFRVVPVNPHRHASRDYSLIVRVLRTRRAPGHSLPPQSLFISSSRERHPCWSYCGRRARPFHSLHLTQGEWPRLPFIARDILTRPAQSAPRRALLPREHSFTVRVLRARRAPGHSLFFLTSLLLSSLGLAWIGSLLRAAFSPAHPLARRDVPVAQARAFRFSPLFTRGNSQTVLHCAHRGSTF